MTAILWLLAAITCAQQEPSPQPTKARRTEGIESTSAPRPVPSRITDVTVYQGQALVTRAVTVPEGEGTFELVVTPMPAETVDGSLYTEGADGLRVLSTRFRTRAIKNDTRQEVRAKQEQIDRLQIEIQRLQKEMSVQTEDLKYLQKLEGFTGTSLTGLTEKGRLDSDAILKLSRFIMQTRDEKAKNEIDLRQRLQTGTEAVEFAKQQLAELSTGSSHVERDAVILVYKSQPKAGTVRLGYLVGSAGWSPQYRLRAAASDGPVRLEYLAAVFQQTGESWQGVRITLSTARPSLDAAPPDLLPLKMAMAGGEDSGPTEASDDRSQRIVAELAKPIPMSFARETPLDDVLKYVRTSTKSQAFPEGIPIYVDPLGLQEAERSLSSAVTINVAQVPLRTSLKLLLKQVGLTYQVKDGLLTVTSTDSADRQSGADELARDGMGLSMEQVQASGGARLNQAAASDQAKELRVTDEPFPNDAPAVHDGPSVTFSITGRLDLPSRRDPQLLEVSQIELPAEFDAKAVPVLTPRVYRLAKLTNKSDHVLLPGEATIYIGTDFVGRMRLPLVAAGEPFIGGFGVDPQLQVSRRLMQKTRSIQGGNQILEYEFRIGLRNYRSHPVKIQLWDRLPKPEGESVAVNLLKTSAELSADPLYLRTARIDNMLRWDLEVPQGTVGEKTKYINYQFRLEYARDLPPPQFASGGLREAPIGGGAMGGMGGMGGGMRSIDPR